MCVSVCDHACFSQFPIKISAPTALRIAGCGWRGAATVIMISRNRASASVR